MRTTTIILLSMSLLVAGVGFLPAAAADPNYCTIPFVGGQVDRSCEQGIDTSTDWTCWAIGWFCEDIN